MSEQKAAPTPRTDELVDYWTIQSERQRLSDALKLARQLERELADMTNDAQEAIIAADREKQRAERAEAALKEAKEALEYWTADGHLQTFEGRERFRQAAREILRLAGREGG